LPTNAGSPDHVTRPCKPAAHRFSDLDRKTLVTEPGIGDRVIDRLEEVGFHSLAQMRMVGAAGVVDVVCCAIGSTAWRNRRRSLERALDRVSHAA
jgi:hypothetical protein